VDIQMNFEFSSSARNRSGFQQQYCHKKKALRRRRRAFRKNRGW
jgi:hypothetical protein